MKEKRLFHWLVVLNFAILIVFGWFLHQKHLALQYRVEAIYVAIQSGKTGAGLAFCDNVPVFAPVQTIGVDMAHQRAIDFMGFGRRIFSHVEYDTRGTYKFHAHVDGGELLVAVCQTSGQITYAENPREVQQARLTIDEGLTFAAKAVTRGGYEDMALACYHTGANTLTATFAAAYADMPVVDVVIGLDNGRIMGFFTKDDEA